MHVRILHTFRIYLIVLAYTHTQVIMSSGHERKLTSLTLGELEAIEILVEPALSGLAKLEMEHQNRYASPDLLHNLYAITWPGPGLRVLMQSSLQPCSSKYRI